MFLRILENMKETCSEMMCFEDARAKGLCRYHYGKSYRENGPARRYAKTHQMDICVIEGCDRPFLSKGLCDSHYGKMRRRGLTVEQLNELESRQACDICGVERGESVFNLDHDHGCCDSYPGCGGCVRGVLCRECNLRLVGDLEWTRKALDYLERYAQKESPGLAH